MNSIHPPLEVTNVLIASLRLYQDNWRQMFVVGWLANMAAWLVNVLISAALGRTGGASVVADVIMGQYIFGLLLLVAADRLAGLSSPIQTYLAKLGTVIGPLVVLGLLAGLLTGLAALAFLLPAIYVGGRLLVMSPIIVFEEAPWQAMRKSWALTADPYTWPAVGFGLLLSALILVLIVVGIMPALMFGGMGDGILARIFYEGFYGSAIGSVFGGISATATLLLYLRLKELTTGGDVSDVFE